MLCYFLCTDCESLPELDVVEQPPVEAQPKRERRDSGLQGVSSAPTEVYDSADMAALIVTPQFRHLRRTVRTNCYNFCVLSCYYDYNNRTS